MIRHKRIYHDLSPQSAAADDRVIGQGVCERYSHGNKGKDGGADSARAISVKVEQSNRKTAKDDRKLQP